MSEAFEVARVVRRTGTRRAGAAVIHLTEGADKCDLDTGHAPIDCEARSGLSARPPAVGCACR